MKINSSLLLKTLAFAAILALFGGFKFKDLLNKVDNKKENYEVKESTAAAGVRGLDSEESAVKDATKTGDASSIEIPYVEITAQELENFKINGGLK